MHNKKSQKNIDIKQSRNNSPRQEIRGDSSGAVVSGLLYSNKEVWIPIKGHEKTHLVSNFGRIFGIERKKIVNPTLVKRPKGLGNPYFYISLTTSFKKQKLFVLHRIVALHFLPNPKKLAQVNHIDGNKLNNNIKNLEWISMADNMKHAGINNLMPKGEKHFRSKFTSKQVIEIKKLLKKGITHKKISEKFNVHRTTITAIRRNVTWKHI